MFVTIAIVGITVAKFYYDKNEESADTTDTFKYAINFPQFAGHINEDLVINDNIDKNNVRNKEILGTYYVVNDKISDSRKEEIKKSFKMDKVDAKTENEGNTTIEVYNKGDEQLTIYDNGTYHYKKNKNRNETKMKSVEFEEEVLIEVANEFLKDKDLIPGDFSYNNMGETVIEILSTGEKKTITKNLYFNREINGIEVEGTSQIVVFINGDGEVEELYSSYREIEEVVVVKENYTVDEMINSLKRLDGTLYINENADEVILEDVEVIYYEDSAPYGDNITIQPIYRVNGSNIEDGAELDKFVGLTSAVKR